MWGLEKAGEPVSHTYLRCAIGRMESVMPRVRNIGYLDYAANWRGERLIAPSLKLTAQDRLIANIFTPIHYDGEETSLRLHLNLNAPLQLQTCEHCSFSARKVEASTFKLGYNPDGQEINAECVLILEEDLQVPLRIRKAIKSCLLINDVCKVHYHVLIEDPNLITIILIFPGRYQIRNPSRFLEAIVRKMSSAP